MRIFKNKAFDKWATKEGLTDDALRSSVSEIERGLVDAELGGHVLKKRVALVGRGKSGGARTLLAYQVKDKAFFVYGFAKNAKSNIKPDELKALKMLAAQYLGYNDKELNKVIKDRMLIEVSNDG